MSVRNDMNKQEPIRVLHIVGRMDRGGIENFIMNIYRNIDREKVQFDFLCHYGREASFNKEIREMGGKIYEMPALRDDTHVYYWKLFKYISALKKFFKEHKEYEIIHGHMTNTASIYMPIARKNGVANRISHSHSTHGKSGMLGKVTNLLQRNTYKYATDWFACSKTAAYWLYPQSVVDAGKVTIIPNAVDAEKFRFCPDIRKQIRAKLGVSDKFVIGCVGRFRTEKNQSFLIKVLAEMIKQKPNSILLFAGDGPLEENVKKKATDLCLEDKCLFLGERSDVADLMQSIDVLAMPSLFEGLPVTGIEAQASGLHVVASTGVPDEMNILDMVDYISLDAQIEDWVEHLIMAASQKREDTFDKMKSSGFDIHTTSSWLENFYLNKSSEELEV